MRLNTLKPAEGSKPKKIRVGRGIGSGFGKTSGKGGKGQTARTGGKVRPGFEGGQQPLQRRLPKIGFKTAVSRETAEVMLSELKKCKDQTISLDSLKAAGLVHRNIESAKIVLSGKIEKAVNIKGLKVTTGAKKAIEAAGGKVEG